MATATTGRLLEGLGDLNPDWMRLNVIGDVLVSRLAATNARAPFDTIAPMLSAALTAVRLDVDAEQLVRLRDRLCAMSLFENVDGVLRLSVSVFVAATKLEAVRFIQEHLRSGLRAAAEDPAAGGELLRGILHGYAEAADLWRLDPVEARWPVLKAAASLSARERAQLAAFLGEPDPGARTRLADSLSLMLENPIPRDWLAHQARHLVGRDIMIVTPEGLFNAAGGLGRVTQYHTSAMAKLAGEQARVWVFEPMYRFRPASGSNTELVPIDYAALARALGATIPERVRELTINVRGHDVTLEVHRSRLADGRVACLLGDPTEYFARVMYAYRRLASRRGRSSASGSPRAPWRRSPPRCASGVPPRRRSLPPPADLGARRADGPGARDQAAPRSDRRFRAVGGARVLHHPHRS